MWGPDDLVAFLGQVLHEVARGLTLDYAFQKVKRRWRPLPSFKPFYDAAFDAVRNYHLAAFAARLLFGGAGGRAVAKAWFLLRADAVIRNAEMVRRYRKRLLKRARAAVEEVEAALEGLRREDPVRYLSVRHSYDPQVVGALARHMPLEELEALLKAGNVTWTWLRVNAFKADVDKAVKMLEGEAEVEPHPRFPFALLVRRATKPIQYLTAVKAFAAVPQDIASIYAVASLAPEPGDVLLDMAAAPGMKASLFLQMAEGRARVVAVDVSQRRAARMRRLLKAMGVSPELVDVVRADSRRLAARRFHKALLDAPCTSSGAFTKDPAVKVYPRIGDARRYAEVQRAMLKRALELADGVVYAVCSILPEEGEEVTAPFGVERPLPDLSPGYGGLGGRTFPHVHRGEAFYIGFIKA